MIPPMLFMIVETFPDTLAVYRRLRDEGRSAPAGFEVRGAWVDAALGRCFMLVEADEVSAIQAWAAHWEDLGDFEVVPVLDGSETARRLDPLL